MFCSIPRRCSVIKKEISSWFPHHYHPDIQSTVCKDLSKWFIYFDVLWKLLFVYFFIFRAYLKYPEKDTVAKNIPITTVDPLISKTRISAAVTDNLETIKQPQFWRGFPSGNGSAVRVFSHLFCSWMLDPGCHGVWVIFWSVASWLFASLPPSEFLILLVLTVMAAIISHPHCFCLTWANA